MSGPRPGASKPVGHLAALDGLRGFAVLLVFCVHAAGNAAEAVLGIDFDKLPPRLTASVGEWLLFWLYRSHHGVFLFFVLSGFLIARLWWPQPRMGYGRYVTRRTLRIVPAFLVAYVASLAFNLASGNWQPPDWPRVVGNLFFLNGLPLANVRPLNPVTWSLFYEVTFYLVFPVALLLAKRLPMPARWIATIGILLPALVGLVDAGALYLCWSLLFCGAALTLHEPGMRAFASRIPGWLVIAAYLAATTVAMLDRVPPTLSILAFGGVAMLAIAKALAPHNIVAWLLTRRTLTALGRISYSFYLVHWMIVVLIAREVGADPNAWGPVRGTLAIFGGGFVGALVAGALLWRIAEQPYFAWVARGRA